MGPSLTKIFLVVILLFLNQNLVLAVDQIPTAAEIISLTNVLRQSHGLSPLKPQPQLMKAAEAKARAMIASNSWSHNTPTHTPWQYLQKEGYIYLEAGENLAKGFVQAEDIVAAWFDSPSHQANLLNPIFTDTGVAVIEAAYQDKDQTALVVQFMAQGFDPTIEDPPYHLNYLFNSIILILLITIFILAVRLYCRYRRSKRPPDISHWHR